MKHLDLIHLDFLYYAVSWVLLRWHQLFSLFLGKNSGLNWSLSIVMLVVTARLLLVRLFIKQVHFQRRMQEMGPRLNELKVKYKDDRQLQQQEILKMQREEGFNPLAGCLPIFLQLPIFLGLYHVLRHLAYSAPAAKIVINHGTLTSAQAHKLTLYGFSQSETISAARAKLFGAPLAASFRDSASVISANFGGDGAHTRLVILPLLLISALATFCTQLLVRRNQTTAPTGTNATIQRLMLWLFPIGVLASGLLFNFPLGVLLYWFATNTWTLAQQAYIIRFHPPEPVVTSSVPTITQKALAPRPGQKPNQERARAGKAIPPPAKAANPAKSTGSTRPGAKSGAKAAAASESEPTASESADSTAATDATPTPAATDSSAPESANGASAPDVVPGSAPRPQRSGQRTTRPASRPAAKRPSQAKKRR